jgi:hypothetical protein
MLHAYMQSFEQNLGFVRNMLDQLFSAQAHFCSDTLQSVCEVAIACLNACMGVRMNADDRSQASDCIPKYTQ